MPVFNYLFLDGKIIGDRKEDELRKKYLSTLKEGQLLQAKWQRPEPIRTIQMHKYLFGVVYKLISEEIGHSVEEVHELMKFKFLRNKKLIMGEWVDYFDSTRDLSQTAFWEYVEKIKAWAKRFLNIDIPEPNQVDYDKIYYTEED